MRSKRKYLDFTISDSVWKKQQPFITVSLTDGNKNAKALQRWNPGRYKTEWRIRLKNSHTKEQRSHPLIETIYRDQWIIAVFNTHEAIDAIMGILPTVFVGAMMAGIIGQVNRKENDKCNTVKNAEDSSYNSKEEDVAETVHSTNASSVDKSTNKHQEE